MREHQRAVEQEVRELLVRAGPRPALPPEDAAAIKAAARDEWLRLVEDRRRRRRLRRAGGLALAASLVLAVVAGWWWSRRVLPQAPPLIASVELVTGDVRVAAGEGPAAAVELAVGARLAAGTTLETAGWGAAPARLALALDGGGSLRLDAGTRVRLGGDRRLELERGAVYFDSRGMAAAGGAITVVTALGTVRDIGTQLEVRASAGETAVRVRVREGRAALDGAAGSHLITAGEQLSLQRDGAPVRAAVEVYGPEWEWVVAAAPVPEVEGRSLDFFLDWYSRETGRRVRWADPSLAAAAPAIELSAPVADQTADEVLTNLLRASLLAYEIENGTVLIREL